MATVTKDFRIKSGLVVEGTSGTINSSDIITAAKIAGGTQSGITVAYTDGNVDFSVDTVSSEDVEDIIGGILGTGLEYTDNAEDPGSIDIDRTTVDTWYDAAGAAATAQENAEDYADGLASNYEPSGAVSTHADLTTTHGVTGDIVGTTDTQDLSNKRIIDTLHFTDGVTVANEGEIAVKPTTHEFEVKANYGNLDLKTVATAADVNITSQDGDILLNPDGFAYLDSKDEANKIATQGYVDAATAGLNVHEAVQAATVENINLATELENGDLLDGATLVTGNRVLVKNQTTKSQNGVYVVQVSGAAIRAADYNSPPEVDAGDFIFVESGDVNGKTGWVQTNTITTVGTDNIEFTQFSGAGTYSGGTGIHLDGNIIEIDFTEFDSDDVTEGTTNLYFTDTRAVDALEAVVPNFDAVEVNSIAKQIASSVTAPTASTYTAYAFAHAEYRSAKFLVKMASGTHTQVSEVLLTLDTSNNVAITEYALVGTNGSLGDITAFIGASGDPEVSLNVTVENANTIITVYGTLLV